MSEVNSRATVPGVDQEQHKVLPEALPVVALRELDLDDVEVSEDFHEPRAALLAAAILLQHFIIPAGGKASASNLLEEHHVAQHVVWFKDWSG